MTLNRDGVFFCVLKTSITSFTHKTMNFINATINEVEGFACLFVCLYGSDFM